MDLSQRLIRVVTIVLALLAGDAADAQLVCGDCNGDSIVSILDSLVASQNAAGLISLVTPQFEQCNVLGVLGGPTTPGALVDVLDSLRLAQFAAGLPVAIDCASQPGCLITQPAGGMVTMDVTWTFDLFDLDGDSSDLSFEWSSDAGVTWNPATASGASPLANPALAVAPGLAYTFIWDSATDIAMTSSNVDLRVSCDDFRTPVAECTQMTLVDNSNAPPSCTVNSPTSGTVSGDVAIDFDALDPNMDPLTITIEYDAGGGFMSAAVAVTSPIATNPAMGVTPGAGLVFIWDSATDIPAVAVGVALRITVDDGVAAPVSCSATVDVDNNDPPSCTINSPTGTVESGDVNIVFDAFDPESDPLQVQFEYDAGGGFLLATPALASPITMNPATGVLPSLGLSFVWDSAADLPGFDGPVTLRITVDDGLALPATCQTGFTIDNNSPALCRINSPAGGTFSGDIAIDFDATDVDLDLLQIDFEFDAGAGFGVATAAGASALPSPAIGVAPAGGLVFTWDSAADLGGFDGPVTFRITVDDGFNPPTTCATGFDVDNNSAPACTINAPAAASAQSGDVTIDFDALDPEMDLLTITFDFDVGGGFMPATPAPASLLANPAAGVIPAAGLQFIWDSLTDIVGTAAVTFRIAVDDGVNPPTSCIVSFTVDNSISCTVTSPSGTVESADVDIVFDVSAGAAVSAIFDYSDDGGATFSSCTASGASVLPNPAPGLTAGMGYVFTWDSNADVPGNDVVTLRITVDDGVMFMSTCNAGFTIDNRPNCVINSPLSGVQTGDVMIDFDVDDPNGDAVDLSFWFTIDGGATWRVATAAGASPLANPALGVATPQVGAVFIWDSLSDILSSAGSVQFRVTAFDGTLSSTCDSSFSVQNQMSPTCAFTSPPAGSGVAGDVSIGLDVLDANLDPLDVTVQVSTDAGATWVLATPASSSPAPFDMNPALGVPQMAGYTFIWDSAADVPQGAAVRLRLLVSDTITSPAVCLRDILVDNEPSCVINSPTMGTFQDDVAIGFDALDGNGDLLDLTFQFSTNGGITWNLMTPAGASPIAINPALGVMPALGLTFIWDSLADVAPLVSPAMATVRVVADDQTTASNCSAGPITIDNPRRDFLSLRPVDALAAAGTPTPGAGSPGNPKGDWSGLNAGQFNNTVALLAGGNPVILYQVGDTFQMVLEATFSLPPVLRDVAMATSPDGTTAWSSDNGNVTVGPDGLLTGAIGNACSMITATFTPNGSSSFGGPQNASFAACVDLGGVDRATRTQIRQDLSGPNLTIGDLDLDIPGLPSGPVPPAMGGSFAMLATMNADAGDAAAYAVTVDWDLNVLSVDPLLGTLGVSDSTLPIWGAPTAVNVSTPGQVRWNDVSAAGGGAGINDIGAINYVVVGGGTTPFDPVVDIFADTGGMTIGAATPRAGIAGAGEATFSGGAGRRALSVRPVDVLGAVGTPIQGAASPGNPSGDWASLNQGEFNNVVSLFAGGNPVLLYNVGDTHQLVVEAAFDAPPLLSDIAIGVGPDGLTSYNVAGSAVTIDANGLITAQTGNECSRVTVTYVPGGAALGPVLQTNFAACVDLGGVDRATREAVNQAGTASNLTLGDVDADLPGMPSGMPPVGVGTSFGVPVYTNSSDPVAVVAFDLGVYQIDFGFDQTILALDVGAGTMGISASTRAEFGTPTAVNPGIPGLVRFNDVNFVPGVLGANDFATVNLIPVAPGTTLLTQQVTTLADVIGLPIGPPTPRLSVAGRGAVEFMGMGDIDLSPSAVSGPAMVSRGTSIVVNRDIDNFGTLPAFAFDEKIYLSTDATITGADLELGTFMTGFLGGGATDSTPRMVSVPVTVTPGVYFYGVRVDTPNLVPESNEANNSAASVAMVTIVNDVDLTISNVVPTPTSTQAGGAITVSRDVVNLGMTASPGFLEAYYLSADMILDLGDTPLSSFMHGGLAGGAMTSLMRGLNIPAGTPVGTFFILGVVDDAGVIAETDEGNNVAASSPGVSVTSIDLVVHSITVTGPTMLNPLDPTTVNRTLENLGTVASGAFVERVVISTDAIADPGDTLAGDFMHAGIAGGGVDSSSRMITIPGAVAPGMYFIGIILDPADVVAESNETNNDDVSSNTVTINGAIDLEALSVTGRPYATMGLPRRFERSLRNNGGSPSPPFNEGWYLSADATITVADIFVGSIPHAGLAAGAVDNSSVDVPPLPNGIPPGNYFIGVIADWDAMVGESNETNNAVASGASVPIIVEVENLGTLAVAVGSAVPAAPGLAVIQPAGVTSFSLVGLGVYQGSGENAAAIFQTSLVDPASTTLLDGTLCDPVFKTTTQSFQSGSVFQVPNGDTSEHRECGSGPGSNPSNPAASGTYRSRWFNFNGGPTPGTVDLTIFNIRKFDPAPAAGTLYLNIVMVGDFLADNIRMPGDPVGGPYTGPGVGDLNDIITRAQGYYTPMNITLVPEFHFLDGALGNLLEVVDANADANANGVADNQEAMAEATPLSTYEPGNTGLNVFMIRDITQGGGPSSIAGIASGIPGIPVLQGTPHSGVINSTFGQLFSSMSAGTRQVVAEVIAHEGGHELGMFHTTEFSGNPNHDPVPDTIRCLAGTVSPGACAGTGAQYVMFPQAAGDPSKFFTTQQSFIINRNPAVR